MDDALRCRREFEHPLRNAVIKRRKKSEHSFSGFGTQSDFLVTRRELYDREIEIIAGSTVSVRIPLVSEHTCAKWCIEWRLVSRSWRRENGACSPSSGEGPLAMAGSEAGVRSANFHGLAADVLLDSIQGPDASHRIGGRRRSMNHMDVVEFTPAVSPTCVRVSPGKGEVM